MSRSSKDLSPAQPVALRTLLGKRDALAMVLIALVYGLYFVLDTQSSEFLYAIDIGTTIDDFDQAGPFSVDDYFAPWRYRLVPRLLPWVAYQALNLFADVSFRAVTIATSGSIMALAFVEFYVLLRVIGLPVAWSWMGWLLSASSFPVVFGYRGLNYMTLDDTLSFALLLAAMLLLFYKRYRWFVVVSVIAPLTRETNLLLVIVVFFDKHLPLNRRVVLAGPMLLAAGLIRVALWEVSEVTTTGGLPQGRLLYNLVAEGLVLTSAYFFAVFGFSWLLGLLGWFKLRQQRASLTRPVWIWWATAPVAVGLLLMFNLVIGSIRENRILFLVFPWVIGLGITYLYQRRATLLNAKHLITLSAIVFILLLPPLVFLLVVPGGEGLRLATLSRVPGYPFLYWEIWSPFRIRFTWIPGQLVHILFNVGMLALVSLFFLADRFLVGRRQQALSASS